MMRHKTLSIGIAITISFLASTSYAVDEPFTGVKDLPDAVKPLDSIVAVVNNGVITQSTLDKHVRLFKHQLQKQHISLPPKKIMEKRVLERLVVRSLATTNGT